MSSAFEDQPLLFKGTFIHMNYQELLESLDDYGDSHTLSHAAAQRIRQLESILSNLKGYVLSNLKNDRDAYLFHLIEWGQGLENEKPIPEDIADTTDKGITAAMETALILLATRSYMTLMERDPGQAGLWHTMITEALLPLGEQRALEEVKRILALI